MWRWALAMILAGCSSMRAVNYSDGDTTAPGAGGTGISLWPGRVEYDPVSGFWGFATDGAGANPCEEYYSRLGVIWHSVTPIGWGGVAMVLTGYIISPTTGVRVASFQGADQLFYTLAGYPGVWAPWNGIGGTGNTYMFPETDGSIWVVYNSTAGTLDWQANPAAGGPPAAGVPQPGFAGAPPPLYALKHSRHDALEADQYDTGNPLWMAITATEVSSSVDGSNWTAAALHGIPIPGFTMEYSAHTRRWHTLDTTAGNLQHFFSEDNGVTWIAGTVIDATLAFSGGSKLASDRFGTLVCLAIDSVAVTAHVYASVDDGATWTEVAMPSTIALNGGAGSLAGYGGGRFMLVVEDGAAPATYYPFIGLASIDQ